MILSLQVGEGRALYNLGNVYHAKGKHAGRSGHQDPGDFPQEVTDCLKQAIQFYEWVYIERISLLSVGRAGMLFRYD